MIGIAIIDPDKPMPDDPSLPINLYMLKHKDKYEELLEAGAMLTDAFTLMVEAQVKIMTHIDNVLPQNTQAYTLSIGIGEIQAAKTAIKNIITVSIPVNPEENESIYPDEN